MNNKAMRFAAILVIWCAATSLLCSCGASGDGGGILTLDEPVSFTLGAGDMALENVVAYGESCTIYINGSFNDGRRSNSTSSCMTYELDGDFSVSYKDEEYTEGWCCEYTQKQKYLGYICRLDMPGDVLRAGREYKINISIGSGEAVCVPFKLKAVKSFAEVSNVGKAAGNEYIQAAVSAEYRDDELQISLFELNNTEMEFVGYGVGGGASGGDYRFAMMPEYFSLNVDGESLVCNEWDSAGYPRRFTFDTAGGENVVLNVPYVVLKSVGDIEIDMSEGEYEAAAAYGRLIFRNDGGTVTAAAERTSGAYRIAGMDIVDSAGDSRAFTFKNIAADGDSLELAGLSGENFSVTSVTYVLRTDFTFDLSDVPGGGDNSDK